MSDEIAGLIHDYQVKTAEMKARLQNRLFTIFTETTGYRPEDLCIVERQTKDSDGIGFKTVIYFDLKHRHEEMVLSKSTATTSGDMGEK
jgi:hypothetical protein